MGGAKGKEGLVPVNYSECVCGVCVCACACVCVFVVCVCVCCQEHSLYTPDGVFVYCVHTVCVHCTVEATCLHTYVQHFCAEHNLHVLVKQCVCKCIVYGLCYCLPNSFCLLTVEESTETIENALHEAAKRGMLHSPPSHLHAYVRTYVHLIVASAVQ